MAANPSILGILIGLTLVTTFAAIFGLVMVEWTSNYEIDGASDINLSKYDQLTELHLQAEDIKDKTTTVDQPTGIADVLGGIFYNAYQVLVSIPQSFNLLYDITDAAVDDADLGAGGIILKNALTTIILFIIFVGIVLSILLKRDGL